MKFGVESESIKAFDYSGSRTGDAGYPQALRAVRVECASHAILAANLRAYRASELWHSVKPMTPRKTDGWMGGAPRYPSCLRGAKMGIAALHPSCGTGTTRLTE